MSQSLINLLLKLTLKILRRLGFYFTHIKHNSSPILSHTAIVVLYHILNDMWRSYKIKLSKEQVFPALHFFKKYYSGYNLVIFVFYNAHIEKEEIT